MKDNKVLCHKLGRNFLMAVHVVPTGAGKSLPVLEKVPGVVRRAG